jgi:hypothetical protein
MSAIRPLADICYRAANVRFRGEGHLSVSCKMQSRAPQVLPLCDSNVIPSQ